MSPRVWVVGALVALAGCGSTDLAARPVCVTRCGLRAASNCAELQGLEDAWLTALPHPLETSNPGACLTFTGWLVQVHEWRASDRVLCTSGASWPLAHVGCAIGYTHTEDRWIETADDAWRTNALAHELVHVFETVTAGHAGHCHWQTRGIKDALRNVTGEGDPSPSDCPGE